MVNVCDGVCMLELDQQKVTRQRCDHEHEMLLWWWCCAFGSFPCGRPIEMRDERKDETLCLGRIFIPLEAALIAGKHGTLYISLD